MYYVRWVELEHLSIPCNWTDEFIYVFFINLWIVDGKDSRPTIQRNFSQAISYVISALPNLMDAREWRNDCNLRL